ncbi:hypothetical protein D6783_06060 [Candidatus Woesearchaeota archaeon]|nr:MAG: hypothetical protein D6783_06060 [Candidatus Woesearchaeota archaeon]
MEEGMTTTMDEARKRFVHVDAYLQNLPSHLGVPEFLQKLDRSLKKVKNPNIIYPVGDPIFVHIFRSESGEMRYNAIEPRLSEEEERLYQLVLDRMIAYAHTAPIPDTTEDVEKILVDLLDNLVEIEGGVTKPTLWEKGLSITKAKIVLTRTQYEMIKYYLIRNRVGFGKLDPILKDPYLEDVHCTGVGNIKTVHKIFGLVYTNIEFKDDLELDKYVVSVSERVERPTSDAHSVVDAMMPDGSRANFIYGRDISLEGTSFTLRKFSKVPISITQVVNWGTMSSELAAYLWIALENHMNLFVCGETASGKTTTLNAICAFIPPDDKVYTVENTPEVTMPHDVWQHLLTREAGKSSDVTYQDLLLAALRSRPNYIIVGEIRGAEGSIAFQAMQTGHAVMSTFHAGSTTAMIQRITGDPINIPITFVDNLNLCLIQMAVQHNGQSLRRVLSLTEIERFWEPTKKMITRQVFDWNAIEDIHTFRGMFNSYILEQKIAARLGYSDPRKIYDELALRKRVIDRMIEEKIFNYFEVWELIKKFRYKGVKALPFKV